jgi:iron complex outermembrane receptor protein
MMKRFLLLTIFLSFVQLAFSQNKITGTITDEKDRPVAGANVIIKGKVTGTVTDASGTFDISTSTRPPLILVVSMVGYQRQEIEVPGSGTTISVKLVEAVEIMDQVVFAASRVDESILESPVSIEKMDSRDIRTTPSMNFYEGLQNLKGVEMVTSGLTFMQINTRGFNGTGNSRFLQLVDGVDNQTPGLGFAVGNMFGSSDLDMESAELIPGAASALYGPVAFNGVLMMRTKDPFQYQGLSAQVKVGANHFGESEVSPHMLGDYSIRYAKAFNNKFAFKVNASYMHGLDWYATNYDDVDPETPASQRGPNNPARNGLNLYGDDGAALPSPTSTAGRVSRTGYEEKDLTDYNVYSLKLNGALHYRITENATLSYQYNFGQGTANYTGSNRFSINNFTLQQHRVELKGANFFVRGYTTIEDSHDSYNAKGLGQAINSTWRSDSDWYARYEAAWEGNVSGFAGGNQAAARSYADQGRYLPGTPEFEAAKATLIKKQGNGGAGILSQSALQHVDAQYDLSGKIKVFDLLVGGNFRRYNMFTNGTLFDDAGGHIFIKEGGAFVQAGKKVLNDKLKVTASIRYDKNQNFDGHFTPRAAAVFSANKNHHFRGSFQTGFRNPTPGDQYIKLNAGVITILGGVPDNSRDLTVYQNSFTTTSLGAFGAAFGQSMQQTQGNFPASIAAAKDQLVKSDVAFIKPERVKVWEIGYKGLLNNSLVVDANYYFNSYNDFILNQVVMEPQHDVLGADGKINPDAAADIIQGKTHLYQLYTNASDRVTSQGGTLGLTGLLPRSYTLGGNVTYASFNIRHARPEDIPAFNTPKFRTAVTFGNAKLTDQLGFNVAWRWQSTYDWISTFNGMRPGTIKAYNVVDAQISYKVSAIKSIVKIGGSNILNNRVYQAYGSPSIGAVYYVSLTFDELFR